MGRQPRIMKAAGVNRILVSLILVLVLAVSGCGSTFGNVVTEDGGSSLEEASKGQSFSQNVYESDDIVTEESDSLSVTDSSGADDGNTGSEDMSDTVYADMQEDPLIDVGSKYDRGMIVDNIYNDPDRGVIHFSSYFPDSYSGEEEYALFVTNPGWEGEYPQGLGNNLGESFPFEARQYNDRMIILSTQLMDWGQTSAEDSLALIHHFLDHYAIDQSRVYLHGYSGGGETGSLMMDMEPELFAGVLLCSTKWDGNYREIAKTRTPLRLSVGESDSYYGSEPLKEAYQGVHHAYEDEGLSEEEIDELLILDVKPHEWFTERGYSDEHAGGNAFGEDEETMSWLFSQVRK